MKKTLILIDDTQRAVEKEDVHVGARVGSISSSPERARAMPQSPCASNREVGLGYNRRRIWREVVGRQDQKPRPKFSPCPALLAENRVGGEQF